MGDPDRWGADEPVLSEDRLARITLHDIGLPNSIVYLAHAMWFAIGALVIPFRAHGVPPFLPLLIWAASSFLLQSVLDRLRGRPAWMPKMGTITQDTELRLQIIPDVLGIFGLIFAVVMQILLILGPILGPKAH